MPKAKVFDTDELMKMGSVHKGPSAKKVLAIVIPFIVLILFAISSYL